MILYIGGYVNEKIIDTRNLKFRNIAGSNRMIRLAKAIKSTGEDIEILSPGTSLKSNHSKSSCHSQYVTDDGIGVFFGKTTEQCALTRPLVSYYSFKNRIQELRKTKNIQAIIIFNTSIEELLLTMFLKLTTRIPIINNIEDVTKTFLSDWKKSAEVNALFHLGMTLLSYINVRLSSGIIVPTKEFLNLLPKKENCVITGCIDVPKNIKIKTGSPLTLLFSGKIEFEHGIKDFIDALTALKNTSQIKIIICGGGSKAEWLKQILFNYQLDFIDFKGFVTNKEYNSLLYKADVCFVLQNPKGRYGKYKTPSKFYEYYSHGKYVISTNCGDYESLPSGSFYLLKDLNVENIVTAINQTINNIHLLDEFRQNAYNYALNNFDSEIQGAKVMRLVNKLR